MLFETINALDIWTRRDRSGSDLAPRVLRRSQQGPPAEEKAGQDAEAYAILDMPVKRSMAAMDGSDAQISHTISNHPDLRRCP